MAIIEREPRIPAEALLQGAADTIGSLVPDHDRILTPAECERIAVEIAGRGLWEGVELTPTGPHWKAWTAWVALVAGFGAAIAGALLLGVTAAAFGASLDDPPPAVNILATVVQDLGLIGAAVLMARVAARPHPWDFGLRGTRFWPAVGWTALTWVSFLVFTALWVTLLGADSTDDALPSELGADESTVALVAVAVLVCVLAPLAEEFFFRGYFFTALRSWRGVLPAAIVTGDVAPVRPMEMSSEGIPARAASSRL